MYPLLNIPDLLCNYEALIVDANVLNLYPSTFRHPNIFAVPGEESSKCRSLKAQIEDWLFEHRINRHSKVLVIGGGVTLDLGGFVMATYHRGTPWDAMPTTLLAMVDASIGGKVAINTPSGKNLIGAFHPASQVHLCLDFLTTLSSPMIKSALSEMIKHLLLTNPEKLEDYPSIQAWLTPDAIKTSIRIKTAHTNDDLHDHALRSRLNAGHTFAHALELYHRYQILHGDAVHLGLLAEGHILMQKGLIAPAVLHNLEAYLLKHALLPDLSVPCAQTVYENMQLDKKNTRGAITISNWYKRGTHTLITSRTDWDEALRYLRGIQCHST